MPAACEPGWPVCMARLQRVSLGILVLEREREISRACSPSHGNIAFGPVGCRVHSLAGRGEGGYRSPSFGWLDTDPLIELSGYPDWVTIRIQ